MTKYCKPIILCILLSILNEISMSQTSFQKRLENEKSDTSKLNVIFQYAQRLSNSNRDSIEILNQLALSIVNNAMDKIPPEKLEQLANQLNASGDYKSSASLFSQLAENDNTVEKKIYLYSRAAYTHSIIGEHQDAVSQIIKSLELTDTKTPKDLLEKVYIYAAYVYRNSGDILKAEKYFEECLKVGNPDNKTSYYHVALHEKGNLYLIRGDYRTALKFQHQAMNLRKKLELQSYLIFSYHDISVSYSNLNLEDSVQYFLLKAISLEKLYDATMLPYSYIGMANSFQRQKNYPMTKSFIDSSYFFAEKFKIKPHYQSVYSSYSSYYESVGDYKNALHYYKLYQAYSDSISNEEITKQVKLFDIKYETAKKDKELIKNGLQIQKQRIFIFSILTGLLVFLIFSLYIVRLNKKLKRTNQILSIQKDEITQKNEEIKSSVDAINAQAEELKKVNSSLMNKNKQIEEQNINITESITYAQRIQSALLPSSDKISEFFKQNFILYMPRDIVSGDFLWIKKTGDKIVFALADCTGHGVPGAFVSIMGISILNEISRSEIKQASEWLDHLRKELKQTLNAEKGYKQIDDGMNIALCIYHLNTKILNYAGAYHNIILIRNNELTELGTNKQPIGIYPNEKPFDNYQIQLQKNDQIYLYSDGIIDQFGGERNGKFKKNRFHSSLISFSDQDFVHKKESLLSTILEWKNENKQLDDITVFGIEIE